MYLTWCCSTWFEVTMKKSAAAVSTLAEVQWCIVRYIKILNASVIAIQDKMKEVRNNRKNKCTTLAKSKPYCNSESLIHHNVIRYILMYKHWLRTCVCVLRITNNNTAVKYITKDFHVKKKRSKRRLHSYLIFEYNPILSK